MQKATATKRLFAPLLLASCLAASGVANADLVTTATGYTGPFIDLSSQANGNYNFTFGPVNLPGMVFTRDTTPSNSGNGAVLGQGGYGLNDNGSYDNTPVYAGLDGATGGMRFMLTGAPVSSFGAYVNYASYNGSGFPDPLIAALDSGGNVIESWDLAVSAPISTPGGMNAFEFRGISLTSASIFGLQFSNSYILATGTANGSPLPAVPEPETYAMLIAGLGLLGFVSRRRKQEAA